MGKTNKNYKSTIAASCIAYVVQAIVLTFTPLLFIRFRQEFGLSLLNISFLIMLNFGVQIATDLLCGKVADKIGYRTSIMLGHFFVVLGLIGLVFLPNVLKNGMLGLSICTILMAVGGGIIEVIVSPLVESLPTENKVSTMSLLHSFFCWGEIFVIMVSTIGFVALGVEKWRIVAALWAFVPAVNLLYFVFVPIKKHHENPENLTFSQLLQSGAFWVLFIIMLSAGAAEQSMSQWASAFAESALKVPKTVGDLFGPCLFAACMGVARLLFSLNSEKIKLQRYMVYSAALSVVAYLITALSGNPVVSLIGCGLVGFTVGILWPATYSLGSAKIPAGGTALFALMAFAGDLGCGFGPALVGAVSQAAGDNLKVGLAVAVIFPIATVTTLLIVNRKLAAKIVKNKGVWAGAVISVILIALAMSTKSCAKVPSGENPDVTPTAAVTTTTTPAAGTVTDTPTPTATPIIVPATETPVPTEEVQATATPTPAPTATKAPDSFTGVTIKDVSYTVYTTSDLNLRKGPGTDHDKYTAVVKGTELKVTGECSNGWLRIEKDGIVLYASGSYTTKEKPAATATPTPTPTKDPNATATPTPEPTATSAATPTPEPTKTGDAGVTPAATATPTPSVTSSTKPTATPIVVPQDGDISKYTIAEYSGFTGKAFTVVDAQTGDIVEEGLNENTRLYPASLAKMMTALIAAENLSLSSEIELPETARRWYDHVDDSGNEIIGIDNSMTVLGVPAGTKLTVEQWLNLFLIYSVADAGDTLAYAVCGYAEDSLEQFNKLMNEKAKNLGMSETHFDNPVGADMACTTDDDEFRETYTTSADLAKLAVAVLKNKTLRNIVSKSSYTAPTGKNGEMVEYKNWNRLLHPDSKDKYKSDYFDVTGIKTGFTDVAGYCLAASGKKGNQEFIVILLGVDSRDNCAEQAKRMLEYLFRKNQ